MASVGYISEVELINGDTADIGAKRFDGSRVISLGNDLSGTTGQWNGDGNVTINATINNGAVTTDKIANGAVTTAKIANGSVTWEKLNSELVNGSVAAGSSEKVPTCSEVKTYVDNKVAGNGSYLGKKTCEQITALTANNGDHCNVADTGDITNPDGTSTHVNEGDNVIYDGTLRKWDRLAGDYALRIHTHAISDVTGLQSALDGKQANLPTTGTASATYAINVSGSAGSAGSASSVSVTNTNNDATYRMTFINAIASTTSAGVRFNSAGAGYNPSTNALGVNITGNAATATKLSNITNSPNNKNLASADTDGNVYVVSWTNTYTDSSNGNLFMLGGNSRTTRLRWLADDYSTASGSTTTSHYGHLIWNPTSRYDITFPNASGTVALTNGTIQTATNANNINVTKFAGATRVSGQAGQYGLFPVMVDGFGNRAPYTNDGSIGFDKDADTATDGYAQLNLGNATAAGNAGAKKGTIKFYGKANGSVVVQFNEMSTSNRIQYLQDATGTIPLQFSNVGSGDFNNFTNIGLHSMNGTFSNAPSGWGSWCSMLVATRGWAAINQLAFSGASNGGVAVRNRTGTGTTEDPYTWTAWKYLATTGDLATAIPTDTIDSDWNAIFG